MRKLPITFNEKVNARFTRKAQEVCWIWEGGVRQGRPAINNKHVMRYIYEQERGPIPPGHTLWRIDHTSSCNLHVVYCKHMMCVNPWHVEARALDYGLYRREVSWRVDETAHQTEYARRRPQKRGKKGRNDNDRNQEGGVDAGTPEPDQGLRVEKPDVSQQGDP
jgi:hypothetical protein